MNLLILNVTLEKIESRASDKTWKLIFNTQELSSGDVGALTDRLKQYSYMALKEAEMSPMDLDELTSKEDPDKFVKGKTPGQRLRAVLFLLAQQQGKEKEFANFYENHMERLITMIKEKLDETT